jgi:hypothetical protein
MFISLAIPKSIAGEKRNKQMISSNIATQVDRSSGILSILLVSLPVSIIHAHVHICCMWSQASQVEEAEDG